MAAIDILFYVTVYISLFVSIFWLTVVLHPDSGRSARRAREPVTIIVPAYNKADTIEKCLVSLARQAYQTRVIVVDDGSTDSTGRVAGEVVKKYRNFKYMRKKNGGKASALNLGLKYVKTKYFGFLDADTYLKENSLEKMIPYFKHGVACVTTIIKVDRPRNIVERIQNIEYALASFTRKLLSFRNALYYTPGFALYKTGIIKELGGFDEGNITEDLEIGLRLKSRGYRIDNCTESYVHTEVPKSLRGLFSQRIRWYRGHIHNTKKYSKMFFNRRFGDLGIFVLPFQYIVLVLTSMLLLLGIYDSALSAGRFLIDLYITNFDVRYLLSSANINLITYTTFFWVVLFALFTLMIRVSEKKVGEKISIREYMVYIVLYPFINLALWLNAFILELAKKEIKLKIE